MAGMNGMNTSVVIVDAPSVLRTTVARALSRDGGMSVSTCDDAATFAAGCPERPADIALVSIELVDAVTSLPPLRRAARYHHLVAWGSDPPPSVALMAIRRGADGVLDKHTSVAGMIRALTAIARGQSAFPRSMSATIVEELQRIHRRSEAQARIARISRREREVLALITLGYRNAAIAEELGISEPTAKRHVHNILEKLGVATRAAAARLGLDAGDDLRLPHPDIPPKTSNGHGRPAVAAR
jgi:DNA-binding NarL/FixJ family response regulator